MARRRWTASLLAEMFCRTGHLRALWYPGRNAAAMKNMVYLFLASRYPPPLAAASAIPPHRPLGPHAISSAGVSGAASSISKK